MIIKLKACVPTTVMLFSCYNKILLKLSSDRIRFTREHIGILQAGQILDIGR